MDDGGVDCEELDFLLRSGYMIIKARWRLLSLHKMQHDPVPSCSMSKHITSKDWD